LSLLSQTRSGESAAGARTSESLTGKALLAGVLVLTGLVYLPVLRYEFVYDDQGIIVENPMIRSWRYLPQYFQGQLWEHLFPNTPSNYYRPLSVVLFRVNDALFGLRPMGWHAYTLLLHLLATALVFAIVRRITERPLVAAVAALLFGVHPSHHEVVAWISSTTESLCAVLFFAAFLAYLKSRERWTFGWMSVSCVLYAAGLLAKETAMVLPALIFAHAFLYGVDSSETQPEGWQRRLLRAIARASVYVPVCILYLAVRVHVLHGFSHSQNAVVLSTLLLTLPSVLFFYLRQWVAPFLFSEFYDLPMRTHWDLLHVGLPLALLGAAAAALWYFRRRLGPREVALGLMAIAVPLLPAMNLSVFAAGELVHDRYSYIPSLGAALIAALAFEPLCKGRVVFRMPQRLVLVIIAIVLPLSYCAANAASYWANDSVLFEHAHSMAPQNAKAFNNYAVQVALSGDRGTAMTMLGDSIREHPDSSLGNYNLGRLLYESNVLPAAEHYLRLAQRLDPSMPDPYLQLGMICMRTGRMDEAEADFRRALSLRPDDAKFHFALGVTMAQRQNCPVARSEFSRALALDPTLKRAQEQTDKCGADVVVRRSTAASPVPVRVPLAPVKGP
jgi:Flp pilus assembly protein TadD